MLCCHENVYSKLLNGKSKARNIILFNIPEVSTPVLGQLNNTSFTKDVFNSIDVSINPVSVHRLSKAFSRPWLLRATFLSSNDVLDIFKVKKRLITMYRFSIIRISSDLTLLQRKYLSSNLLELKSRKDTCEHNLFVK